MIDQDFLESRLDGIDAAIKRQKDNFNPSAYVAICDNKIVGYAAYGKERSGKDKTGEIYAIYILDHMQCKGIGSMLVHHCKASLMEYDYMHIWALKDNPNKSFYEKIGGNIVARKYLEIGSQSLETECFEYKLKG
ncbi:GNAT family N-acetyltransferase [Acidaminobacter sp. JC074]|uniref:GNAT family N-acetyltransferase n=1 Tax=Acidaminobacter sp. JC074 TaxID=2530199 RepID=UPI00217164C4|nr:GNAT family N-acetyltransferase [Acidaminobacter sp. JC074]